jgi:hypothetical protein
MIVKRWLKQPGETFNRGDPMVEMLVDGEVVTLDFDQDEPTCTVYYHHISEGQHVGPWGYLLEFTERDVSKNFRRKSFGFRANPLIYRPRARYPRVFLSYRRDDADAYAGRLHEVMAGAFGRDEVFMDMFSIRGGEVFSWTIQQAVAHASVVVALIGPKWLTIADSTGEPRLKSERDFVRRELSTAWDRRTTILPILLPGAEIPKLQWDYDDLSGLSDLQMSELSARHWEADVAQIIADVKESLVATDTAQQGSGSEPPDAQQPLAMDLVTTPENARHGRS